ncbi:MAG: hypothetical protein ABSD28_14675 [Tepidisphaeraceae bacterium]
MDAASTSFVLGYHGCDRKLAERVFSGHAALRASHNDYDWLGDGIYFWEHNADRAFDFATEVATRRHRAGQNIKAPAVVGAIIDLGFCLNLLDARFIEMVRAAYEELVRSSAESGIDLPRNTGGHDLLKRNLDCAVVRTLHQAREDAGKEPFETVRAAFVEGERLYENAGFSAKNHIQVCVRDPRCIKAYFRPLNETGKPVVFS